MDDGEAGGYFHRCGFVAGKTTDTAPVPRTHGPNVDFQGIRITLKEQPKKSGVDFDNNGRVDEVTGHFFKNTGKVTVVIKQWDMVTKLLKSTTTKVMDAPDDYTLLPLKKADIFEIDTTELPHAMVSRAYSQKLKTNTEGEDSQMSWSKTGGQMPAGINNPTAAGVVAGTPTTEETKSFQVSVTYTTSPNNLTRPIPPATHSVSLRVLANLVVSQPGTISPLDRGQVYGIEITATGGTGAPYDEWTHTGTLPTGMSFAKDGETGQGALTGTPTANGQYTFTVKVTDKITNAVKYTAEKEYTVTVTDPGGG